jgi:hypothetical protein
MIEEFCNEIACEWRKSQRQNLALTMHAILRRRSLTLSHLAQHFPAPAQTKVAAPKHSLWHRLKRLRRFLSNPRLQLEKVFERLTHLAMVVSDEPGLVQSLLVDLTYMEPYAFLVVSTPKEGRALPIAWQAFRRDLVGEPVYSQNQLIDRLLISVLNRLPKRVQAVVVADREFARASFLRRLKQQRRDFVVRVDRETWVLHPDYSGPMGALVAKPGTAARWLPNALYAQTEQEAVNLLAVWLKGYEEPWLLASSLPDPDQVFALYRQRMKIEHGFRDWKTHLRLKGTLLAQNVEYVKGLLTVLALLYWFVAICGLHWNQPRFHMRIACWGRPSFFKTALELLFTDDALALPTWPAILAWLRDKLRHLYPLPKLYLLRYRRFRPRFPQTG